MARIYWTTSARRCPRLAKGIGIKLETSCQPEKAGNSNCIRCGRTVYGKVKVGVKNE